MPVDQSKWPVTQEVTERSDVPGRGPMVRLIWRPGSLGRIRGEQFLELFLSALTHFLGRRNSELYLHDCDQYLWGLGPLLVIFPTMKRSPRREGRCITFSERLRFDLTATHGGPRPHYVYLVLGK